MFISFIKANKIGDNRTPYFTVYKGRPVIVSVHSRSCGGFLCYLWFGERFLWCGGGCFSLLKGEFEGEEGEREGVAEFFERGWKQVEEGFGNFMDDVDEAVEYLEEKIVDFWNTITE